MRNPAPRSENSRMAASRLRAISERTVSGGHQEVRVGAAVRAADPAAELVELGQAVAVGAVHDQGVGARDVEAVLDDGGGHEHVGPALHEGEHGLLELGLRHLPVGHRHPRLGHQALHQVRPGSRSTPRGCGRSRPGPSRSSSWRMAAAITSVENLTIAVWMARRSLGGVSITDMSRMPASPICRVRGMGVAERVRQSTVVRSCLSSPWPPPRSAAPRRPRGGPGP